MRFLTLLLSIYILLITLVPCHCDDDCAAECREENHNLSSMCMQITAHNDGEDADGCQDRCTPFCCCANQHIASIVCCQINLYHIPIKPVQPNAVLNCQYTEKSYSATLSAQKLPPEA